MKIIKIVVLTLAVVVSTAAYGLTAEEFDPSTWEEADQPALQMSDSVTGEKNIDTDGRVRVEEPPRYYFEDEDEEDGWPKGGGE